VTPEFSSELNSGFQVGGREIQLARTYQQIQGQIAKLQSDANKLRQGEVAGVVARIKEAIAAYGLTAADLFGNSSAGVRKTSVKAPKSVAKAVTKSKISASPKFADGSGNEWVGRGPRPQWLRDALNAGRDLSEFAVGGRGKSKAPSKPSAAKSGKSKAGKSGSVAIKYRDAAGNTWTGRGSQPRWLKAAVGAGRSIEQFRI
jgi:DNA-binding protein H-NS